VAVRLPGGAFDLARKHLGIKTYLVYYKAELRQSQEKEKTFCPHKKHKKRTKKQRRASARRYDSPLAARTKKTG